jgi:hypothetical protein
MVGYLNISLGWAFMIVGIFMGSIMGMYAFKGPLKAPKGHEDYTSLARRMIRLAHIAFVALPMISILYGMCIDTAHLSENLKHVGSYAMIFGMLGVPILLIAASFYNPIKYLEVFPVSAIFAALGIIAWGYWV